MSQGSTVVASPRTVTPKVSKRSRSFVPGSLIMRERHIMVTTGRRCLHATEEVSAISRILSPGTVRPPGGPERPGLSIASATSRMRVPATSGQYFWIGSATHASSLSSSPYGRVQLRQRPINWSSKSEVGFPCAKRMLVPVSSRNSSWRQVLLAKRSSRAVFCAGMNLRRWGKRPVMMFALTWFCNIEFPWLGSRTFRTASSTMSTHFISVVMGFKYVAQKRWDLRLFTCAFASHLSRSGASSRQKCPTPSSSS
ncbi:hypothetical protein K438DRAFT_1820576 [Mycena galopus ATCC 62051]|nr:hypothetical protein K438DRAFT_1820576 [Mycena galopus ATCC 62051]